MAIIESPPRSAPQPVEVARAATRSFALNITLEQAAYAGLFVLALLVHLWGLGDRALHHDETLHAYYSWLLYRGEGLLHDPLLHGPFLYNIVALGYGLFGADDFTARLSVALFGSVLVVLPYLIRRELGRGAALAAACYLLISPAFLYVGRFIRHDMYAVVFELLTFISIVRYASTRQRRWLYLGALALGLMWTTMETFYLYVAMFGGLLVLLFLWRVWRPGMLVGAALGVLLVALVFVLPGKPESQMFGGGGVTRTSGPYVCPSANNPNPPDNPILAKPGPIFGFGALETEDNDYALCVRHQPDDNLGVYLAKIWQFARHPAILLAIALSLGGLVGLGWLIWRRRDADGLTPWQRATANGDSVVAAFATLGRDRRLLVALAFFLIPYVLLFTTFFSHPVGVVSGAAGSLLYWLAQHGVQRGGQPWYYYLVQLVVYEPVALLFGLIGLVAAVVIGVRVLRGPAPDPQEQPLADDGTPLPDWRSAMPLLLAWWTVSTFAIYSWAGEKMPWLTVHVALPLVLLAAWTLARMVARGLPLVEARVTTLLVPVQPQVAPPAVPIDVRVDQDLANGWQNGDTLHHEPNGNGDTQTAASLAEDDPEADAPRGWYGGLIAYLLTFSTIGGLCFLLLSLFTRDGNPSQTYAPYVVTLGLVLLGLLNVPFALLYGLRRTVAALAVGLALVGALYGMRSSYQLSFRWGDIPREVMIYNTTSPDVVRVIRGLHQAIQRGGNSEAVVWYDNETVWDWYTHDFKAEEQASSLPNTPGENVVAVLMLKENFDANPQIRDTWQGFVFQRYPLRWALPEYQTYRLPENWRAEAVGDSSPLLMRLLRNPLDSAAFSDFWQYMIYRQLPAQIDSTDFVLAVRPEIAADVGGTGTGGPPIRQGP
ncbi:MAG: TIGR03663 family protein [Roseiflexaceae bacterium]